MSELISVIVPVYNVEKYLPQCLDSLLRQTYKNLEIILVDDGSTDRSGEICEEYAQKDTRIRVIHQKNAGAGAAKNTGLKTARGEYIALFDSDDYLENHIYERMLSVMNRCCADAVQCMFTKLYANGCVEAKYKFKQPTQRILTNREYLFELLYDWKYSIFANKLFKAELVKNIYFPEGRAIDDEFFTYKVMAKAKRIVNITEPLFNYRIRQSSVMQDTKKERILLDRLDYLRERYAFICEQFPGLKKTYEQAYADLLLVFQKEISPNMQIYQKLQNAIAEHPYRKPGFIGRIKNKRLAKRFSEEETRETQDLIPFK